MDKLDVDVAVIGAGTAGMVACQRALKRTDRVILIEARQYGTTCARVGCMPSKLLIAAADHAHQMREAQVFGISADRIRIDGKAVMARVRKERDRFVGSVIESVARFPAVNRMMGRARFADPHRLIVEDASGDAREVHARSIVIATGSRPNIPGFLKQAEDRLVVNDDLFEWTDLPESVAVFGPGVIGLELGQALSRLGVRIRMFGVGGGVGPIRDKEVRACALETFNREFPLDPEADVIRIERTGAGVSISFRDPEQGELTENFDYLLAATGRRPNVDGLDIQNAEIELDDRGIPLFDPYTLRCGESHIFIAGDANGSLPLLHEAADEGRIAGDNAARYPDVRSGLRRTPMSVVFTDPQIASVGLNIQEVEARCRGRFAVGEVSFSGQGRSRVMARNKGLLRVYAEHGSGLFMGAEMFGPEAEHIAHLLAWSVQNKLTVSQMLDMPFYHPVVEEAVRTALKKLCRNLSIGPAPVEDCTDCGPGT